MCIHLKIDWGAHSLTLERDVQVNFSVQLEGLLIIGLGDLVCLL